jgi:hypothetical protein
MSFPRSARMSRLRRLAVVSVAVLAGVVLDAQRPSFQFQVVLDSPLTLQRALRVHASRGYSCAAVARPTAPLLPTNATVIMGRPKILPLLAPEVEEVTVVVGRFAPMENFERDVNTVAAKGFRLCGFTITAPVWGAASVYTPVAVMTRKLEGPNESLTYRFFRTTGRPGDWAMLEDAGTAGFLVSRVIARPVVTTSGISDAIFVAEKGPGAQPVSYSVAASGNAVALKKEIDKVAAKGHRVQATWFVADRVIVLMAVPVGGSWDGTRDYVADDPSSLRISSFDGELLALIRVKDGAMALYDRQKQGTDYTVIEGRVSDSPNRQSSMSAVERQLLEKLDVEGGRGFWPRDVTARQSTTADSPAVDIVMARGAVR